jgi:hypothetical protein
MTKPSKQQCIYLMEQMTSANAAEIVDNAFKGDVPAQRRVLRALQAFRHFQLIWGDPIFYEWENPDFSPANPKGPLPLRSRP